MTLSDECIDTLFENKNFGEVVNGSTQEKRKLLAKSLQNQIEGYWSGHTIYHIMIGGGLLLDDKSNKKKRLTPLGAEFLKETRGQAVDG